MAVDCTKTALNSTPIEFSRKIPESSFVDNIGITYKPGKMKSSEIVSCALILEIIFRLLPCRHIVTHQPSSCERVFK